MKLALLLLPKTKLALLLLLPTKRVLLQQPKMKMALLLLPKMKMAMLVFLLLLVLLLLPPPRFAQYEAAAQDERSHPGAVIVNVSHIVVQDDISHMSNKWTERRSQIHILSEIKVTKHNIFQKKFKYIIKRANTIGI